MRCRRLYGAVPLDAVLFSLSYNTMPHHRTVLRRAWQQLRPGGRLVIMDAKVPPGWGGRLVLPFSLWLMKHTMLGNPLIHPWQELGAVAGDVDMSECMFSSYYICSATKPFAGAATGDGAANDNAGPEFRLPHRRGVTIRHSAAARLKPDRRLSPCGPPRYTSPAGADARHLQSRNSVRIKTIEPIAVSLPMKKPVKMAGETVTRADNILRAHRNRRRCRRLGRSRVGADHDRRDRRQHDGGGAPYGARPAQASGRRFRRRGGGDGRADVRQQRRQGGDRDRAARSGRPRQGAAAARAARRQAPRPDSVARGHRLRRCRGRFARGAGAPQRRLCHLQDQSRRRCTGSRRRAHAGHLPRARQGLPHFRRRQSRLERGGGRPLRACGRRLRPRLFRAAGPRPRSRRHGESRRGEPRADRRRRGHSFARTISNAITPPRQRMA